MLVKPVKCWARQTHYPINTGFNVLARKEKLACLIF